MSIDSMYQALENKFGPEVLAQIQSGGEQKNEALNKIVKKFLLTAKETPEGTVVEFKAKPFAWGLVHLFRKMFGKSTRESTQLQKAVSQMREIYGNPLEGTEKERIVKDVINAIIVHTGAGKPLTVKVATIGTQTLRERNPEREPLLQRTKDRLDQAMRHTYAPAFASFVEMLEDPQADLEQIYEQIEYVERECKKVISATDKLAEMRSQLRTLPESPERDNLLLGLHLRIINLEHNMETQAFEELEESMEGVKENIEAAKDLLKPKAKVWEEHAVQARTPLEKYTEMVSKNKSNPISFGIESLKMCFQMIEEGVTAENRKEVEKVEKALVDKLIAYEKNLFEKHESYRHADMAGGLAQIVGRRREDDDTEIAARQTKNKASEVPLLTKASRIEFEDLRRQAFDILKIDLPKTFEEAKSLVANFNKIVKEKEKAFNALYATVLTKREEQAAVRNQEMTKAQGLQQIYSQFEQQAIKDIDALKKTGPQAHLSEMVIKAMKFELQSLKSIESEDLLKARIAELTSTIASLKPDLMKHAHAVLEEVNPKMRREHLANIARTYAKELKAYPFLNTFVTEAQKPVEYTAPKQRTGVQMLAQQRENKQDNPIESALQPHIMGFARVSNVESEIKAVRERLTAIRELETMLKNRVEELRTVAKDDNLQELIETVKTRFPLLLSEDFEADEVEEFTDEITVSIEPSGETKDQFYTQTKEILDGYNYLLKEGLALLTPAPKKTVNSLLREMKNTETFGWDKEDDYKALINLLSTNPQDPTLKAKTENLLKFCTTEAGLEDSEVKIVKTQLRELLKLYP